MADLNTILPLPLDSTTVPLLLNTPTQNHLLQRQSSGYHTLEESPKNQSPESIGIHFLYEQKLSAFSIYNGESSKEKSQIVEEDLSINLQIQGNPISAEPKSKSTQSKDKRQKHRIQTKNMNRFFRSKLNEMLRQIRDSSISTYDINKAKQVLQKLNHSNKIMFSEIGEVIKNQWLRNKLLSCRGMLLKYVHKGKMGMQSKLTMLKYFNKIMQAVKDPQGFSAWK